MKRGFNRYEKKALIGNKGEKGCFIDEIKIIQINLVYSPNYAIFAKSIFL